MADRSGAEYGDQVKTEWDSSSKHMDQRQMRRLEKISADRSYEKKMCYISGSGGKAKKR